MVRKANVDRKDLTLIQVRKRQVKVKANESVRSVNGTNFFENLVLKYISKVLIYIEFNKRVLWQNNQFGCLGITR